MPTRGCEYGVAATAFGNVVVPIEKAGVMERVSSWVAVCGVGAVLSVALTVKVELPLARGVPEIVPAALSESPVGSVPEARDHA